MAVRGVAARAGIKAALLINAARVALTGQAVAPPLFATMELLGQEKVVARLQRLVDSLPTLSRSVPRGQAQMKRGKGRRGKGPSREAKKKPAAKKKLQRGAPPKPYEFLDHPADVGFQARGKSLAELFAIAAQAMCDYGWELNTVRARETIAIRARAATVEDLLYSWLSEVLFLIDAEHWVFKRFTVSRVETIPEAQVKTEATKQALWEVRAMGRGERFDQRRHRPRTYIKAVTYHQLAVEQRNGSWQATVYLDV